LLVGHCFQRHIIAVDYLHGLAVQSIRDQVNGLQIALLCFLDYCAGCKVRFRLRSRLSADGHTPFPLRMKEAASVGGLSSPLTFDNSLLNSTLRRRPTALRLWNKSLLDMLPLCTPLPNNCLCHSSDPPRRR
jgi:hypothetical protein